MDTTLIVLAAGMGSRFGGLKQMTPVCNDGRVILDFSVEDAAKAGFNKFVFILRDFMAEDFKHIIGKKLEQKYDVSYVIQDTTCLPEGRTKPFGTAHAILCCRDVVKTPFAVINADDYYGPHAFLEIHDHLIHAKPGEYAMVAYLLENTLSKNGSVARGVCQTKDGYLTSIVETTKIFSDGSYINGDEKGTLKMNTPVSMNLWGLTLDIFPIIEKAYKKFLETANLLKDEVYIPMVIGDAVKDQLATVKVYENVDRWYGITYKEDLPEVKEAIQNLVDSGVYSKNN